MNMNEKILFYLTAAEIFVLGICGVANAKPESNLLLTIPPLIAAGRVNSQVPDCNGVLGGTAIIDACGVCGGDGSSCGANIATVTSTTGQVWMDRNLGASRVATSYDDDQAYGDLYQWGRGADGHENRASSTTSNISSTDSPGHGNFIEGMHYFPEAWRAPQNDKLWQGVTGINNPCPPGFRLPTEAELTTEMLSWKSNNAVGAFNSPLKLVAAGFRWFSGDLDSSIGSGGFLWSSTVNTNSHGNISSTLNFTSSNARISSFSDACGLSVRCIKD